MFDPKSDYALNKMDPEAIVYIDSRGTLIRLTVENFASPEEFQRWKKWSDGDYHKIDNAGISLSKRTLSLDGLSEQAMAVQSPEDILIILQEQQEREELRRLLMKGVDSCLTQSQRRRLWLYCVDGLSEEAIALAENVRQQSVSECLSRAKDNLKKFLTSPL
ncbi:MAG: sigma-70 family RNA polymerase sigma factor [Lachnospiraceae bacterium]|nr:sigma-70 family RNA polymerase sigma factor [Lachnospiraceae bacterium]